MADDEDEDPKIIGDNENSNLSSFSNFMKNNLFNTSAINSENNNNTNNKINQNLDVEDKGYYNVSNRSNNYPSFSQNINVPNYDNNKANNLFQLSKYSFGSLNDFDKNYPKNNINNINSINNNINNINQNLNINFNINNNNYFGGIPKKIYNNQLNSNQSYDFYSNIYKIYNINNYMNFSNNKTFINNNINNTFIDNPVNFNIYNKNTFNINFPHKKKTFKNKNKKYNLNHINNNNENGNSFKKNINNQNNVSGFSKLSSNLNNASGFSKISNNQSSVSGFSKISNNQNNVSGFSKMSNNHKNNKIVNNNNEKMIAMIKDQNKNKYIQKKIEEKNALFLHNLYKKIKHNLYEIINDQYGNYVIQTYIDHCDKQILSAILKQLFNYSDKSIYEISINKYGTRALQKLFQKIANNLKEEEIDIIKASIKGNITSMIKSINGNHVIQSIIEYIKNEEIMAFMYKEINQNLIEILKTKPGYCVFSKMIKHFNSEYVNNIFENILNNIDKLINDEYGNFIIQSIIKINNITYNNKIYNYIYDKIVLLSCQKYSSKVIECCMADSSKKIAIIRTIIKEDIIKELIIDKFGNYIVQNALVYFKDNEEIFFAIINEIKKNIDILKNGGEFGQKIYDRLKKNYGQYLNFKKNNNGQNNI